MVTTHCRDAGNIQQTRQAAFLCEAGQAYATILCIDDDPNALEIHKALLESKGYRVLTAPDGSTGIGLTRKYPIDAVVLDFNMPDMNGDQVAQVLLKEQPTVPVVFWSGCPEEIPESMRWFASALLHKATGRLRCLKRSRQLSAPLARAGNQLLEQLAERLLVATPSL